jgi:4-alpha-glucanotransferase
MVGTHDTPPLARVVEGWRRAGAIPARAAYLAERLAPADGRAAFAGRLAADASGSGALAQALFADLFASPARHALVFMSDLFGLTDVYNTPGKVSDDNWSLRVPNDFEATYRAGLAAGTAMDVYGALALALRARGGDPSLIGALEALG